jgi:hypothetical protein
MPGFFLPGNVKHWFSNVKKHCLQIGTYTLRIRRIGILYKKKVIGKQIYYVLITEI